MADRRLKDALCAAYSELQNGRTESAKVMLKVGLMGGSVTNPLDCDRCPKEWDAKYKKVPK